MAGNLKGKNKDELVRMIQSLRSQVDTLTTEKKTLVDENTELKKVFDVISLQNERILKLEKDFHRNLQYQRRDTVEISGIPKAVDVKDLEAEVIKVYEAAKVKVHGQSLRPSDIQACHRIGKKKETTIVKFVSRKFAFEGLVNGRNLKDNNVYGNGCKLYINTSFCDAYRHLNFLIRGIKGKKLINHYKVRKGTNMIQIKEGEDYYEIEHVDDLVALGLYTPEPEKGDQSDE